VALDAIAALAVAVGLQLDVQRAADDLVHYQPVGMRMAVCQLPGGVRALNDAYNANPDSMCASLGVLASLKGRRVAVLGDMLELGPDESVWHDQVVAHARSLGLDFVVCVGERMARAGEAAGCDLFADDPDAVVESLGSLLKPGDTVLFKGSRGARVERVLKGIESILRAREIA
jgi:UDP-N-acetylmuramoyl-tripeptide--D-alanyl-D-alanine ligase